MKQSAATRRAVEEVLAKIHRAKYRELTPAERAARARAFILETGRLLGVPGLRPRMRTLTIVTKMKEHLEAGAQDGGVSRLLK
jgi:hypothetical protein